MVLYLNDVSVAHLLISSLQTAWKSMFMLQLRSHEQTQCWIFTMRNLSPVLLTAGLSGRVPWLAHDENLCAGAGSTKATFALPREWTTYGRTFRE